MTKSHEEIRAMLPAFAGGDLAESDRLPMERHLAGCPDCQAELAQLKAVVHALRATPELEPPPWLAARIMARVREEKAGRQSWLARLFLPLHLKLPLEALALVTISLTVWYVMQDVTPKMAVQPAEPVVSKLEQQPMAKDLAVPAAAPQARYQTSKPVKSSVASSSENSATKPVAQPVQQAPAAPAFAPPPQMVSGRASDRMERSKAASESAPEISREMAAGAPAPMAEKKMAARRKAEISDGSLNLAVRHPLRIRLLASDRATFTEKLRESSQSLGGAVIESHNGSAVIRIDAVRLPEFLERIARIGQIVERPSGELPREGTVELQIFW